MSCSSSSTPAAMRGAYPPPPPPLSSPPAAGGRPHLAEASRHFGAPVSQSRTFLTQGTLCHALQALAEAEELRAALLEVSVQEAAARNKAQSAELHVEELEAQRQASALRT